MITWLFDNECCVGLRRRARDRRMVDGDSGICLVTRTVIVSEPDWHVRHVNCDGFWKVDAVDLDCCCSLRKCLAL